MRGIAVFLAVAYGFSWLVAAVLAAVEPGGLGQLAFGVAFMFGPALGALAATRGKLDGCGLVVRPDRWWLLGWLAPVGIAFAAAGVAALLPNVWWSLDLVGVFERYGLPAEQVEAARAQITSIPLPLLLVLLVVQALVAGATINAVAAFGEELGWRGFLYRALEHLGFWRSSFVIGVVWGLWHAPLVAMGHNYPQHPMAGIAMMVVFCVLLAPLLQLVRERSSSVFAASILHGSINASAGFALLFLGGGNDLVVGLTGLAGFVVLAAIDVVIFLTRRA